MQDDNDMFADHDHSDDSSADRRSDAGDSGSGDTPLTREVMAALAHPTPTGTTLREPSWSELVELSRQLGPDPQFAGVADAELEHRMKVQAAQITALTCRWIQLLGELVVRGVWADQGARSPAQWLSYMVGMAASTARDHVRVALRLRELPAIRAEFAAGRLSYSKVRALTRIARPELQDLLLRWSRHATAADVERIVRGTARCERLAAADPAERTSQHGLRLSYLDEHTAVVTLHLPVDEALELVEGAARIIELENGDVDADPDDERETEAHRHQPSDDATAVEGSPLPTAPRRPTGQALVDAVVASVRTAVANGPADTTGADRTTLVLHVDADSLAAQAPDRATPVHSGRGELAAMSPAALRRLACDAGLVPVVIDGDGTPVDVGRRQRTLTTALRRALLARDRSCRFPGCGATRHLHAHHIIHWADDGPTDLPNLVLLCGFHHRFVHEHGWTLVDDGDKTGFAPPGGAARPPAEPVPQSWPPQLRLAPPPDSTADPDALRTGPGWAPGEADHDLAVSILVEEIDRLGGWASAA